MALPAHREACLSILAQIYVRGAREICIDQDVSFTFQTNADDLGIRNIKKSKVLFYTPMYNTKFNVNYLHDNCFHLLNFDKNFLKNCSFIQNMAFWHFVLIFWHVNICNCMLCIGDRLYSTLAILIFVTWHCQDVTTDILSISLFMFRIYSVQCGYYAKKNS